MLYYLSLEMRVEKTTITKSNWPFTKSVSRYTAHMMDWKPYIGTEFVIYSTDLWTYITQQVPRRRHNPFLSSRSRIASMNDSEHWP